MYSKIHNKVFHFLEARSKFSLLAIGYALVAVIAWVDFMSGQLSMNLFYLVPVFLVGWFVDKRSVIVICLAAGISSLFDRVYDHPSNTPFGYFWDFTLETTYMILLGSMFATLREKHDKEVQLARIDPLTRVLNRRYLYEIAEKEIYRSSRYNRCFSVAYLDLDNFKAINDKKGHHVGDDLLCSVAGTIIDNIRCADMVARIGGDEFVVLLPETGAEEARSAMTKLQEQLLQTMEANDWAVSFSVGVVTYYSAPGSVDEMLKRADGLMYEVKSQGKNALKHEVVEIGVVRQFSPTQKPVPWIQSGRSLLSAGLSITNLAELRNKKDLGSNDHPNP